GRAAAARPGDGSRPEPSEDVQRRPPLGCARRPAERCDDAADPHLLVHGSRGQPHRRLPGSAVLVDARIRPAGRHQVRLPEVGGTALIRTVVFVVGSGVAGALVGWQLAQSGAAVTILEAGPPIDRDAAVEVFRAATAKVPESPYPNTAWAPRPS